MWAGTLAFDCSIWGDLIQIGITSISSEIYCEYNYLIVFGTWYFLPWKHGNRSTCTSMTKKWKLAVTLMISFHISVVHTRLQTFPDLFTQWKTELETEINQYEWFCEYTWFLKYFEKHSKNLIGSYSGLITLQTIGLFIICLWTKAIPCGFFAIF